MNVDSLRDEEESRRSIDSDQLRKHNSANRGGGEATTTTSSSSSSTLSSAAGNSGTPPPPFTHLKLDMSFHNHPPSLLDHSSNNLNLFDEFMEQIAAISSANVANSGHLNASGAGFAASNEMSNNQPLKIKTKGIEATLLPLVNQVRILPTANIDYRTATVPYCNRTVL